MARSYAGEMARLAETFAWASATDLQPLRQAVRIAGLSPLRAIGSGGSLTSAHALASLHRRYTGHVAVVATPLEAVNEPLDTTVATWLLSAGGSNVDIMAVAKTLILREPRQLGVLCGRDTSPLAKLCRQHPFVDLLLYVPPAGRDGFLATNSLLGCVILLTRAYTGRVRFGCRLAGHRRLSGAAGLGYRRHFGGMEGRHDATLGAIHNPRPPWPLHTDRSVRSRVEVHGSRTGPPPTCRLP